MDRAAFATPAAATMEATPLSPPAPPCLHGCTFHDVEPPCASTHRHQPDLAARYTPPEHRRSGGAPPHTTTAELRLSRHSSDPSRPRSITASPSYPLGTTGEPRAALASLLAVVTPSPCSPSRSPHHRESKTKPWPMDTRHACTRTCTAQRTGLSTAVALRNADAPVTSPRVRHGRAPPW